MIDVFSRFRASELAKALVRAHQRVTRTGKVVQVKEHHRRGSKLHEMTHEEMQFLHKRLVEKALREGRTVPKKVMAHYPDLAEKYGVQDHGEHHQVAHESKQSHKLTADHYHGLKDRDGRGTIQITKEGDKYWVTHKTRDTKHKNGSLKKVGETRQIAQGVSHEEAVEAAKKVYGGDLRDEAPGTFRRRDNELKGIEAAPRKKAERTVKSHADGMQKRGEQAFDRMSRAVGIAGTLEDHDLGERLLAHMDKLDAHLNPSEEQFSKPGFSDYTTTRKYIDDGNDLIDQAKTLITEAHQKKANPKEHHDEIRKLAEAHYGQKAIRKRLEELKVQAESLKQIDQDTEEGKARYVRTHKILAQKIALLHKRAKQTTPETPAAEEPKAAEQTPEKEAPKAQEKASAPSKAENPSKAEHDQVTATHKKAISKLEKQLRDAEAVQRDRKANKTGFNRNYTQEDHERNLAEGQAEIDGLKKKLASRQKKLEKHLGSASTGSVDTSSEKPKDATYKPGSKVAYQVEDRYSVGKKTVAGYHTEVPGLAVHKDDQFSRGKWRIIHLASGETVDSADTKDLAMKLAKHAGDPARVGVHDWTQNMDGVKAQSEKFKEYLYETKDGKRTLRDEHLNDDVKASVKAHEDAKAELEAHRKAPGLGTEEHRSKERALNDTVNRTRQEMMEKRGRAEELAAYRYRDDIQANRDPMEFIRRSKETSVASDKPKAAKAKHEEAIAKVAEHNAKAATKPGERGTVKVPLSDGRVADVHGHHSEHTPGLVVHESHDGKGWTVTHHKSGHAVLPPKTRLHSEEDAVTYAKALGAGGKNGKPDWTIEHPSKMSDAHKEAFFAAAQKVAFKKL